MLLVPAAVRFVLRTARSLAVVPLKWARPWWPRAPQQLVQALRFEPQLARVRWLAAALPQALLVSTPVLCSPF